MNVVNARLLARERGLDVTVKSRVQPGSFTRALRLDVKANGGKRRTEGAVVGRDSLRLVRFDDYDIDGVLEGSLIITMSDDRPGMVGRLGTIIGESGLNIANLSLGRTEEGGNAMAIFNLDSPASEEAIGAAPELRGSHPSHGGGDLLRSSLVTNDAVELQPGQAWAGPTPVEPFEVT